MKSHLVEVFFSGVMDPARIPVNIYLRYTLWEAKEKEDGKEQSTFLLQVSHNNLTELPTDSFNVSMEQSNTKHENCEKAPRTHDQNLAF